MSLPVSASCSCGDECQCVECNCPSVLRSPLTESDGEDLALGFAALSDPVRLRLVSLLASAPDDGISVCDLISPLGRSQSTVSHHLKVLADAGIVAGDKHGRLTSYRVVDQRLSALRTALEKSHVH